MAMLHTKFQAVEPEEEDFLVYFTCVSRIPWDRNILNKFGKGPCYILNIKYFSHEVLKKKIFECFSMYF